MFKKLCLQRNYGKETAKFAVEPIIAPGEGRLWGTDRSGEKTARENIGYPG